VRDRSDLHREARIRNALVRTLHYQVGCGWPDVPTVAHGTADDAQPVEDRRNRQI